MASAPIQTTASAIIRTLESANVPDSNGENANVVDAIANLANGMFALRNAVTPNICGGNDVQGGHVESLTEAVMGVTKGLTDIASAIRELASAVESKS